MNGVSGSRGTAGRWRPRGRRPWRARLVAAALVLPAALRQRAPSDAVDSLPERDRERGPDDDDGSGERIMLQRNRRLDVWVRILLTIGIILAALVTTAPARAQVAERTTTVTVHDAATGEPIPGVAIRVGGDA